MEEFDLLPNSLYNMKTTKEGNLVADRKGPIVREGGEEEKCMICLSLLQTGEIITTLRCLDSFH